MEIDRTLMRDGGFTGDAEQTLPDEVTETPAHPFATWLVRDEKRTVAVGRDTRASSPRLHAAVLRGLAPAGLEITDVGVVPSPLVSFAVKHYSLDGAIMVTGGHRSAELNGLALMRGNVPLGDDALAEVIKLAASDALATGEGTVRRAEILDPYVAYVRGNVRVDRAVKVVVDAAHGVVGSVAAEPC